MRGSVLLLLSLSFGPGTPTPEPDGWETITVAGLPMLVGPKKGSVGLDGYTATFPVRVAGGSGTGSVRQGLTRDIDVTVKEVDVAELAKLFGQLPAWLKPKLVGRIGKVELNVRGDAFALRASGFRMPAETVSRIEATGDVKAQTVTARIFAFGGLVEYSGKLPAGE